MKKNLWLLIPGKAVALTRPRLNFGAIRKFKGKGSGGGPLVFTPRKCLDWQKLVRLRAVGALKKEFSSPELFKFPLQVELVFFIKRPKKISKFSLRPDIDNFAKCVLDGLQGAVYEDDSFITKLMVSKIFVNDSADEKTTVMINELE
jgi:Holliday junction resolvase RusA-like endonuclease